MAEANRPPVYPKEQDDSLEHHVDDDNHTYEIKRMRMIQVLNIIELTYLKLVNVPIKIYIYYNCDNYIIIKFYDSDRSMENTGETGKHNRRNSQEDRANELYPDYRRN